MPEEDQMGFWSKRGVAFEKQWKKRISHICKPCWELKYCPYGALVEQFPVPVEQSMVEQHIKFLKEQLGKGAYKGEKKDLFKKRVRELDPKDYPIRLPKKVRDMTCSIFGHLCPVFFVNEPFSETVEMRKVTRYVPKHITIRVARRDNNTCQICGKNLKDTEIEFHHRIPYSRGGATDEENLEVACSECNKAQGYKIPESVMRPVF